MRAVVFAYHNMGIVGIRALLANGFEVPAVFAHADDPKENRWFGSVTEFCREKGIPVHLPGKVNDPLRPISSFPFIIGRCWGRRSCPSRGCAR